MHIKSIPLLVCLFIALHCNAQTSNDIFAKNTTATNRIKEYRSLVNNSINKNLSLPLTDSTEDNWQDAFSASELLRYHTPWVDGRIRKGFDSIQSRSLTFQRSFLELIYTNYSKAFIPQVVSFLNYTENSKLFAMLGNFKFSLFSSSLLLKFFNVQVDYCPMMTV